MLETKQNKEDNAYWAMILVMTKCDWAEKEREVSKEDVLDKAREWKLPLIETSGKDIVNVKFVYQQAIYAYWVNSAKYIMAASGRK